MRDGEVELGAIFAPADDRVHPVRLDQIDHHKSLFARVDLKNHVRQHRVQDAVIEAAGEMPRSGVCDACHVQAPASHRFGLAARASRRPETRDTKRPAVAGPPHAPVPTASVTTGLWPVEPSVSSASPPGQVAGQRPSILSGPLSRSASCAGPHRSGYDGPLACRAERKLGLAPRAGHRPEAFDTKRPTVAVRLMRRSPTASVTTGLWPVEPSVSSAWPQGRSQARGPRYSVARCRGPPHAPDSQSMR